LVTGDTEVDEVRRISPKHEIVAANTIDVGEVSLIGVSPPGESSVLIAGVR
jgi:hypothetical protein